MSIYDHIASVASAEAVKSISEQLKKYQIPSEAMEIIKSGIQSAVTVGITAAKIVRKSTQ